MSKKNTNTLNPTLVVRLNVLDGTAPITPLQDRIKHVCDVNWNLGYVLRSMQLVDNSFILVFQLEI